MMAYMALRAQYLMNECSLTMQITLTQLLTSRKPKPSCTRTTNSIVMLLKVLLLPWSASFWVAVILYPSIMQASSPLQFKFLCY